MADKTDPIHAEHSVIFHAAKWNALDIMELLLDYAADSQAKDPSNIRLLVATIMYLQWTYKNIDKSVALLLKFLAACRSPTYQQFPTFHPF